MQDNYDHKDLEAKWQKDWGEKGIYKTPDQTDKPKYYVLDMFPYPSGDGLHVGHPKGYIATDVISRTKRMQGKAVLHPMGWDAFGLPAENYAIKNKIHPRQAVEKNVARFKEQLSIIGLDYDWSREINTTDPEFYKWTQWIFLKLLEKGLAYESYEPINWCPSCQTGLANEDLEDGKCERCGSVVEKKPMRQWVLKITDYADRLLEDLKYLDKWPEAIKESQRNWIGRSEGAEIEFRITPKPPLTVRGGAEASEAGVIPVFTTRADTLFGVTYIVLAPEHPEIENCKPARLDGESDSGGLKIENWDEVQNYINETKQKTEIERTDAKKEKTGVELKGLKAIHPATGEELPIWVADYVLGNYGTGAVMAVPAHDERDFVFAQKYNLPTKDTTLDWSLLEKFGKKVTRYKLRDWVFSRQRYWGEPIPVIHCEKCGVVGVPEKDLPVKLPEVEHYEPAGTGESPLANITDWVNVECPKCGSKAKRETNTMPQWAGSSWYYLRYIDPKNDTALVDKTKEKYWSPVDMYVGGAEHATRHLIYARFWHKFLYDLGLVANLEPFTELHSVGLVLAEDGRKMSKRYGNVINPDDIVATFGADSLRLYEMFMGPFDNAIAWSTDNLVGVRRFLEKVWRISHKLQSENITPRPPLNLRGGAEQSEAGVIDPTFETLLHKTIKKVTEDIENFKFNTAISAMMIFVNEVEKNITPTPSADITPARLAVVAGGPHEKSQGSPLSLLAWEDFLKLLAPFAPHMTEEIWSSLGHQTSIHLEKWPEFDESKIVEDKVTIVVQVNGKVRAQFEAKAGLSKEEAENMALSLAETKKWLGDQEPRKTIVVPDKVVNFVV